MRRLAITVFTLFLAGFTFAQTKDSTKKKVVVPYQTRSNDHFMIQLGYNSWTNKPDSIHTTGFPRTFNMYLMLDFPFKTDPHWSIAIGPGIAADNMYFSRTTVGIKDLTPSVVFHDYSDTIHFSKYKLATAYLEAPVELRYRFNPGDDSRSVKIAFGAKVGTLVNAHIRGKNVEDAGGQTINEYILKERSSKFFNKTRLSLMARAGYGHFTLFASYAVTPLFKEGLGPVIRPLTFGITLSGL
jgi:hypothetical protein